jgi:steroid delta-isomerase-like uncharacterized protein
MSAQENTTLIRTIHALYDAGDVARCVELAAPDVEWVLIPLGETYRGLEGFREVLQNWNTAFPDAKTPISNLIVAEDAAADEFDYQGTQTGPLAVPGSPIPATGRRVDFRVCHAMQIRDGKFTAIRTYFDSATLLRQLGVMPAPAEAAAAST